MRYQLMFLFVVLNILFLVSCATVTRGGKSEIYITSDPSGIEVEITEVNTGAIVFSGETPKAVVLSKKSGYFKKAAYDMVVKYPEMDPVVVRLEADKLNIKSYIVGNIFSGNIFGWALIDPLTGAMFEWTPAYVTLGDGRVSGIVLKKDGSLKITHKGAAAVELQKQEEEEFF